MNVIQVRETGQIKEIKKSIASVEGLSGQKKSC